MKLPFAAPNADTATHKDTSVAPAAPATVRPNACMECVVLS